MHKNEHITFLLMIVIFTWLISACSTRPIVNAGGDKLYPDTNEVPVSSNFKTTFQYKLQAADHWNNIANDLAVSITEAINKKVPFITLYVERTCVTKECIPNSCDSKFNQVFTNEVETALVNLGNKVSAVPLTNAASVEIDVQTATFNKNRPQYRYAGVATEVNQGIWAVHDVVTVTYDTSTNVMSNSDVVQPTTTDALNWFRTQFATGRTPQTELIVTISVKSPAQVYLARNTSVYYIADGDESHYVCNKVDDAPKIPKVPIIPVKGDCHINRQCN